ncbi:hypothetical protein FUT88_03155 [Ralstonia sp. TCR112]|uniref:E2/UBC family protein n=1 Tax=Ralstonia sp. TCR112 TaxID=2601730 RepID=UPI0011BDC789|nr:E2/UBC family protein [Ralstonia sp. TCR112]TXD63282.1 hypothetical protein FUT88_03155 [Ralstonia sp. TCR112]
MGPLQIHIQRLLGREPGAEVHEVGGSGTMVSLPTLALPAGWSKPNTAIYFLAPQGYPFAKPDCFWADDDLRLANGAMPQNAQSNNPMPGLGRSGLWFSWHTDHWNANRDDLLTWIASIKDRLSRLV